MLVNEHEDDFSCVREMLNEVLHRMSREPFTRVYHANGMQRNLSDIQWMLNHNYYPAPGYVNFVISALRNEKFSVVREYGCQAAPAADIQLMIDKLKDIRKFLELVSRFDNEGDVIKLDIVRVRGNMALHICIALLFVLCAVQLWFLSEYPQVDDYLLCVAIFISASFIFGNKYLMHLFIGLMIITLFFLAGMPGG